MTKLPDKVSYDTYNTYFHFKYPPTSREEIKELLRRALKIWKLHEAFERTKGSKYKKIYNPNDMKPGEIEFNFAYIETKNYVFPKNVLYSSGAKRITVKRSIYGFTITIIR